MDLICVPIPDHQKLQVSPLALLERCRPKFCYAVERLIHTDQVTPVGEVMKVVMMKETVSACSA
jgi:hypothetical protein